MIRKIVREEVAMAKRGDNRIKTTDSTSFPTKTKKENG